MVLDPVNPDGSGILVRFNGREDHCDGVPKEAEVVVVLNHDAGQPVALVVQYDCVEPYQLAGRVPGSFSW